MLEFMMQYATVAAPCLADLLCVLFYYIWQGSVPWRPSTGAAIERKAVREKPEPATTSTKRDTLTPEFRDIYPPSRRHVLIASVGHGASIAYQASVLKHDCKQMFRDRASLANVEDIQSLTATGFSAADVVGLGDFPDYARLSGVPLPQACPKFDAAVARARPYRPFRWAYHQTMCEYPG